MTPIVTKAVHPYVQYGKAGFRKLLSWATNTDGDKVAPETRGALKTGIPSKQAKGSSASGRLLFPQAFTS